MKRKTGNSCTSTENESAVKCKSRSQKKGLKQRNNVMHAADAAACEYVSIRSTAHRSTAHQEHTNQKIYMCYARSPICVRFASFTKWNICICVLCKPISCGYTSSSSSSRALCMHFQPHRNSASLFKTSNECMEYALDFSRFVHSNRHSFYFTIYAFTSIYTQNQQNNDFWCLIYWKQHKERTFFPLLFRAFIDSCAQWDFHLKMKKHSKRKRNRTWRLPGNQQ